MFGHDIGILGMHTVVVIFESHTKHIKYKCAGVSGN